MTRVLITGMAGAGKTTVIRALHARGFRAVDLDSPQWSHWVATDPSDTLTPSPGQDWRWQEARVRALLSGPRDGMLFVAGCAENMRCCRDLIETTILLSAPVETLLARLAARAPGEYGHSAEDQDKVASLVATIEPLLRAAADHEIDARRLVEAVVEEVLRTARRCRANPSAGPGGG